MFQISEFPIIGGPSPDDPNKRITLQFSNMYIDKLKGVGRAQKLFEAWCHIVGEKPPINNIGHHEQYLPDNDLIDLSDTIAVFQGLKRPQGIAYDGSNTYVYVLNPIFTYDRITNIVCMAKKVIVPRDWVFVVYITQQVSLDKRNAPAQWTIIGWEFVLADEAQPNLPANWKERYVKEKWRK